MSCELGMGLAIWARAGRTAEAATPPAARPNNRRRDRFMRDLLPAPVLYDSERCTKCTYKGLRTLPLVGPGFAIICQRQRRSQSPAPEGNPMTNRTNRLG